VTRAAGKRSASARGSSEPSQDLIHSTKSPKSIPARLSGRSDTQKVQLPEEVLRRARLLDFACRSGAYDSIH